MDFGADFSDRGWKQPSGFDGLGDRLRVIDLTNEFPPALIHMEQPLIRR
jgi:hypothetical protein